MYIGVHPHWTSRAFQTSSAGMALSAEPSRKTAYSDDLRWRIVWQRIVHDKPYRDIAKSLNISVGTVHNIWQKFEATGDVSKKVPAERENAG